MVIACAFYSHKKSMVMLCSAYIHQRTMLLYSTFPQSKRWKRKWRQNYYWMTFIQGAVFEEEVNLTDVQSWLLWVLFVLLFDSSPHKSRRINVYPRVTGDPRRLWRYQGPAFEDTHGDRKKGTAKPIPMDQKPIQDKIHVSTFLSFHLSTLPDSNFLCFHLATCLPFPLYPSTFSYTLLY